MISRNIDSRIEQSRETRARKLPRRDSAPRRLALRRSLPRNFGNGNARRGIRKRARKSGEFPEQCVVSIRVSVGVAMRWTLVQLLRATERRGSKKLGETEREREREREKEEQTGECAQERERERERERGQTRVSPSYSPPPSPPHLRDDPPPPRGEMATLGIRPRRGHLVPHARYYFYKCTRYIVSCDRTLRRPEGKAERGGRGKFDGIGQLIPSQRSSVVARL